MIWRCHVGLDRPNELAREAWAFLLGYVEHANAYVFSRKSFAWEGLERAGVRAGESVLVRAGAGGVGHVVVQLAKSRGAHVTATASSAQRAAIVRGLGADAVVECSRDDGPDAVVRLTDGRPCEVPARDFAHLAPNGRTLIVFTAGGDGVRVIDVALVTEIEAPESKPK